MDSTAIKMICSVRGGSCRYGVWGLTFETLLAVKCAEFDESVCGRECHAVAPN